MEGIHSWSVDYPHKRGQKCGNILSHEVIVNLCLLCCSYLLTVSRLFTNLVRHSVPLTWWLRWCTANLCFGHWKRKTRSSMRFMRFSHYDDVIMGAIASQITSLTIVYSTIYSDADQRKHQSFASLAFVWGIHRVPMNSPHKWPVTRKMFPFDDVMMKKIWHKLAP